MHAHAFPVYSVLPLTTSTIGLDKNNVPIILINFITPLVKIHESRLPRINTKMNTIYSLFAYSLVLSFAMLHAEKREDLGDEIM